jgi:hypothetical protein
MSFKKQTFNGRSCGHTGTGSPGTNRSTKGEAGTVECRKKGSKPGEAIWDDWPQAKSPASDRVTLWRGGRPGRGGCRDLLPSPSLSLFFKTTSCSLGFTFCSDGSWVGLTGRSVGGP